MVVLKFSLMCLIFQFGKCLEACVFSKLEYLSKISAAIRLLWGFLTANPVLNFQTASKLKQVQNHLSQSGTLEVNPVLKQFGNSNLDSSLEKLAENPYKSSFLSFYFFLFLLTHLWFRIIFPPFRGEYIQTHDVLCISKLESTRESFKSTAEVVVPATEVIVSGSSSTTTTASHECTNSTNSRSVLLFEDARSNCRNNHIKSCSLNGCKAELQYKGQRRNFCKGDLSPASFITIVSGYTNG